MKVLIIGAVPDRCETFVCREMARAGVEMEVLCHAPADGRELLREEKIPVGAIRFRGRVDPQAIRIIRRRLRSGAFDIVHALNNRGLSNALLASWGLPVRLIAYRGTIGHLSRWDPASWLTYLNPLIRRIICVSEAVRRYLLSLNVPASRLRTIYKGHDIAWYAGRASASFSEFGIPAGALVVSFAGSMRPVKGVDVLLRAARDLTDIPDLHILLLGEVRDRAIRRLAGEERIRRFVHFAGHRKDAAALVGGSDIFVMPSLAREGLPKAVIEAMAQGVPAVVSDAGGLPELVAAGESGLVVPAGDEKALAGAIRFLAGDRSRRQQIGQRGQDRIRTHFDIRTTVERTMALYREVISPSTLTDHGRSHETRFGNGDGRRNPSTTPAS